VSPKGSFIPTELRVEATAIWGAVTAAAVIAPHRCTVVLLMLLVIVWGAGFAGLLSVAHVKCEDDRLGPAFWLAHVVLAATPWTIMRR
jgi:hypothetical protein